MTGFSSAGTTAHCCGRTALLLGLRGSILVGSATVCVLAYLCTVLGWSPKNKIAYVCGDAHMYKCLCTYVCRVFESWRLIVNYYMMEYNGGTCFLCPADRVSLVR